MENIRITQFLRDHHKIIRGLLAQAEAGPVRARSMQAGVEGQLLTELELHFLLEESHLYPALQNADDPALASKIDVSYDEHREIKQVLDESWPHVRASQQGPLREKIEVIRSLFEAHVEEEERDVFAAAERIYPPEVLARMAADAIKTRDRFMSDPEHARYAPERVRNTTGGEQMRKAV